jgi:flagellar M-ring protein FliF
VKQENITKASLTPFAVSASIGIPKSYFTKIWHMRNPAAPGEDPKSPPADQLKLIEAEKFKEIEDSVQGLLPLPPKGDDRYLGVRVVSYDETPQAEIVEPTLAENSLAWFSDNWQTLGLFGLAVFGVVFLRGMVRSAAAVAPALPPDVKESRASQAAEMEQEELQLSQESEDLTANTLKKKFQSTGRGLRDELTELVREDPDAAASVLKLWIGNAA